MDQTQERHESYRERLHLLVFGEPSPGETAHLEEHLRGCAACRAELASLRRLADVTRLPELSSGPDEQLLREARSQLRAALRAERLRPTFADRVRSFLVGPGFLRPAIAGVSLLLAGMVIGRAAGGWTPFAGPSEGSGRDHIGTSRGETRIGQVRFSEPVDSPGQLEVTYERVTPMQIRGTVDDPQIQLLLARALVADENPGVRLRAVNTIPSRPARQADQEVKTALILALKSDENAGVRREALAALRRLPPDLAIRDALLHTLLYDANPGLRIAAVNGLDSLALDPATRDEHIMNVLRQASQSDDNSYIRTRAHAVLMEVRNQ
jgi:hypothetical protein